MIIDSHAHLELFNEKELKRILKNANSDEVALIVSNSVDIKSAKKIIEISEKFPIVKIALGIYPEQKPFDTYSKNYEKNFNEFKNLVLENKKNLVAIGEIGLDFYHGKKENKGIQEKLFIDQIKLAKELDLPIIVHTRGAEQEVLDILEKEKPKKIILHCFCGNMKLVKRAEFLGCFFSIPCSLKRMENFLHLLKIVPREKILTETDAPYLSPFPKKKNEPKFIKETIKKISDVWKISKEEVEKEIFKNSRKIFKIK